MNRNENSTAQIRFRPKEAQENWASPSVTEAALWVENGVAKHGDLQGKIDASGAEGLVFHSEENELNAIVVRGESYKIKHAEIELSGYGCSDFTSRGAAVLADEKSSVIVEDSRILTKGSTRSATIATRGSTLKVYNSVLDTRGGPLPPDYKPVIGPGMMEPPSPLGLGGNCRTHLSMDNSETFFYHCKVIAAGWAGLSTDASGGYVYVEANDTEIDITGNGYCVYADNGCHVQLNDCSFTTGNMAVIQDGNSSVVMERTSGHCEKVGFMLHGGMPEWKDTGLIRLNGGKITSKQEMFQCKSTNADIYIIAAELESEQGVLLRTMVTDDPFYHKHRTRGDACYGVQLTLEQTAINGDILREDTERKLRVSLEDAALTGAITGGADLYLYGSAKWTANKNSYVVLHSDDISGIDAMEGVIITAVAGDGCSLRDVAALPSGGVLTFAER